MAFGDPGNKFWHIDLTTRAGARSAAQQGAVACFIFSGLAALGIAVLGGSAGFSTPEGIGFIDGGGIELVIGLIAGLRLRAGKGAYWAIAAAAFAGLEFLGKLLTFSIFGMVLSGIVLVLIVQGIRGAMALKNATSFDDDDVEAFS